MNRVVNSKKWLVIAYLALIIVKLGLISLVSSPTIFSDEYIYAKGARGLFYEGSATVHETYIDSYPPLYSLILAPAYLLENMESIYFLMKVINAIISSLIVFPAFLLWREFFNTKKALLGATLVGIMPLSLSITPYLMAENIFHVLFLFSIYFIYKSITSEKEYTPGILAGICIGLATLTKFTGFIILLFTGLLGLFFLVKKQFCQVKKIAVTLALAVISLMGWLVSSIGEKMGSITSLASSTVIANTESMSLLGIAAIAFAWLLMYLLYLLLGSGVITNIFTFQKGSNEKEKVLFWLTLTFTGLLVAVIVKRAVGLEVKEITPFLGFTGRMIGRYVDFTLPLIVLLGFIGLKNKESSKRMKKNAWFWSSVTLGGFLLWYFPLLPFNNASLTIFGFLKMAIEFLTAQQINTALVSWGTVVIMTALIIGTIISTYKLRNKLTFYNVFTCLAIFFAITSAASITATAYNANTWSKSEQMELSKWLSTKVEKEETVLIDEAFCNLRMARDNPKYLCTKNKQMAYVSFWLNNRVILGNPDEEKADYIVTRDMLGKELIKETKNGIKVYVDHKDNSAH